MASLAEMRLVECATRLWRAMDFAWPKLPGPSQAALKARVEDGDVQWVLALVLAGWRLSDPNEPDAAEVGALLKEMGATSLLQQISSLKMLLPDSFEQFLNAARASGEDPKLAGAGVYFANAVNDLGDTSRGALHTWLGGVQFREVGQALIRRFPVPSSGRPTGRGAPALQAAPPPASPSRVDRFDRADFIQRTPMRQPSPSAGTSGPHSDMALLRPPTPVLDEPMVAHSYLVSLGWEGAEVERLLQGPSQQAGKKRV